MKKQDKLNSLRVKGDNTLENASISCDKQNCDKQGNKTTESENMQGGIVGGTPDSGGAVIALPKKRKCPMLRAAGICLLIFAVLCGIIYPVSVTLFVQTVFPYEANGSQIIVTLPSGEQRLYGSELIGQNYESAKYLFGRVNNGAPTNLSPESEEYKALVEANIVARKAKLAELGYVDVADIPLELLTSSGSGVDPHISPEAASFQIPAIVAARQQLGATITDKDVEDIIDKYTEGRFLGIFGEKRVNVLLVNLALDGLL